MIDRETLIQVITAAQDSEVSLLMRHIERHEDVDAGNLLRWLVEEHERKQWRDMAMKPIHYNSV